MANLLGTDAAAASTTARCSWLPVRAPVLLQHSTPPSWAPSLSWRNSSAGSIHGSRSQRSAHLQALSQWHVSSANAPDFHVAPLPYPGFGTVPAIDLALGVLLGFLGVAYNHTLLGTLGAAERLRQWPVEWLAALVGAAVGLLAGSPRAWLVEVTRLRSARSTAQKLSLLCYRPFFCSVLGLVPCHTRRGRRAGCLRPCWYWEPERPALGNPLQ